MMRPSAVVLLVALIACRSGETSSPERRRALGRLSDPRSAARIAAVRELAPRANRSETAAIARSAKDAPEEVREVIAEALGDVPVGDAVDALGALIRDPSDAVRARAVISLMKKVDPKVAGYVARAYVTGGPQARAVVAKAGGEFLAAGVRGEVADREASRAERAKAKIPAVQAALLEEAGRTRGVAGELTAALGEKDPVVAVGAARGLGATGDPAAVPTLVACLHHPLEIVATACAQALLQPGLEGGTKALVQALPTLPEPLIEGALGLLGPADVGATESGGVCAVAPRLSTVRAALSLVRINARCPAPAPDTDPVHAAIRLVLLSHGGGDEKVERPLARTLVVDPDATQALAGALYLGSRGGPEDAKMLLALATAEYDALFAARAESRRAREERRAENRAEDDAEHDRMVETLQQGGVDAQKQAAIPKPLSDKLSKLLVARRPASELVPVEHRDGAFTLLGALAAGATKGGADVMELAGRLSRDEDPRLRELAVELADLLGASGQGLRDVLRHDAEGSVALRVVVRDLEGGRPGAVEAAALLVSNVDAAGRTALVEALRPMGSAGVKVLLSLAAGGDAAAVAAVRALEGVEGPEVERILEHRLLDSAQIGAYAAVDVLARGSSPGAEDILVGAAGHPDAAVRARALEALAKRKACVRATGLAALASDVEARVRRAASGLATACKAP